MSCDRTGMRWVIAGTATMTGTYFHRISGPFITHHDRIEVMPVSEHEELREAARVVVEAFFETGELSNMKLDRLRAALQKERNPEPDGYCFNCGKSPATNGACSEECADEMDAVREH